MLTGDDEDAAQATSAQQEQEQEQEQEQDEDSEQAQAEAAAIEQVLSPAFDSTHIFRALRPAGARGGGGNAPVDPAAHTGHARTQANMEEDPAAASCGVQQQRAEESRTQAQQRQGERPRVDALTDALADMLAARTCDALRDTAATAYKRHTGALASAGGKASSAAHAVVGRVDEALRSSEAQAKELHEWRQEAIASAALCQQLAYEALHARRRTTALTRQVCRASKMMRMLGAALVEEQRCGGEWERKCASERQERERQLDAEREERDQERETWKGRLKQMEGGWKDAIEQLARLEEALAQQQAQRVPADGFGDGDGAPGGGGTGERERIREAGEEGLEAGEKAVDQVNSGAERVRRAEAEEEETVDRVAEGAQKEGADMNRGAQGAREEERTAGAEGEGVAEEDIDGLVLQMTLDLDFAATGEEGSDARVAFEVHNTFLPSSFLPARLPLHVLPPSRPPASPPTRFPSHPLLCRDLAVPAPYTKTQN